MTFYEMGDREKLVFYGQLWLAFGWPDYTNLFRGIREIPSDERPSSAQEKCDYFLIKMSEFTGYDLRSHFAHYGIVNTQVAVDEVAAMNLPEPDPPVWTYREE